MINSYLLKSYIGSWNNIKNMTFSQILRNTDFIKIKYSS